MHPTLEVIRGSGAGRKHKLAEDETVVGRARGCAVVLDDAAASRKHALLTAENNSFVIEDLNSRNHTFVNGSQVDGKIELKDEDRVRIGETLLVFRLSAPAAIEKTDDDSFTVLESLDALPGTESMVTVKAEAKLRAILQITQALGQTLDLNTLLATMLDGLFEIFPQASRALVLLQSGDHLIPRAVKHRGEEEESVQYSKTLVNRVMSDRQAILSQDVAHDEHLPSTQSVIGMRIRSIICVPLLSHDKQALGVVQLEAQHQGAKFDSADVQILASVSSQVSILLGYVRLHKEILQQSRLQRELDFAEEVQRDFLPRTVPELQGYRFWSYYMPAGKVGGDYYDFFLLPDGNQVVLLGDVSGKGVPAALRMVKATTVSKVALLSHPDDIGQAMTEINQEICSTSGRGGFITLAICMIDPETHQVTVANAGHLPPILRRADGTTEELADRKVSGCPLGILEGFQYETVTVTLNPGELVVLYSDGINEAQNSANDLYSTERVFKQIASMKGSSPDETGKSLIDSVVRHADGHEQNDDISVVIFSRELDPDPDPEADTDTNTQVAAPDA